MLSSGILQIQKERSDVEAGVFVSVVNSTSFLLRSGINYLFSSRTNCMFKRRADKKGLKIFVRDFSFPSSNFLENMSCSYHLISQRNSP